MTSTREGQFPADYKPDLSLEWAGPYPPKDAQKGEWDEAKHPRGDGGKFGAGSSTTMVDTKVDSKQNPSVTRELHQKLTSEHDELANRMGGGPVNREAMNHIKTQNEEAFSLNQKGKEAFTAGDTKKATDLMYESANKYKDSSFAYGRMADSYSRGTQSSGSKDEQAHKDSVASDLMKLQGVTDTLATRTEGYYVADAKLSMKSAAERPEREVIVAKQLDELMKFSPDQARDDRGRFGSGGTATKDPDIKPGRNIPSIAPEVKDSLATVAHLKADGKITMDPTKVDDVMKHVSEINAPFYKEKIDMPVDANLSSVHLDGASSPFDQPNLGIPRNEMPQIGDENMAGFMQHLQDQGIGVQRGEISPLELHPTQGEMSLGTSAGILNAYRSQNLDFHMQDNTPDGDRILISNDNAILDGHHRWAAFATQALEDPKVEESYIKIDMPAREALDYMNNYVDEAGIPRQSFGQIKKADKAKGVNVNENMQAILDRVKAQNAKRGPVSNLKERPWSYDPKKWTKTDMRIQMSLDDDNNADKSLGSDPVSKLRKLLERDDQGKTLLASLLGKEEARDYHGRWTSGGESMSRTERSFSMKEQAQDHYDKNGFHSDKLDELHNTSMQIQEMGLPGSEKTISLYDAAANDHLAAARAHDAAGTARETAYTPTQEAKAAELSTAAQAASEKASASEAKADESFGITKGTIEKDQARDERGRWTSGGGRAEASQSERAGTAGTGYSSHLSAADSRYLRAEFSPGERGVDRPLTDGQAQRLSEKMTSNLGVKVEPSDIKQAFTDRKAQEDTYDKGKEALRVAAVQSIKDNAVDRPPKMGDYGIIRTNGRDDIVQVGRGGRQSTSVIDRSYYGTEWGQNISHVAPKEAVSDSVTAYREFQGVAAKGLSLRELIVPDKNGITPLARFLSKDQARDDHGRWTSGGGTGSSGNSDGLEEARGTYDAAISAGAHHEDALDAVQIRHGEDAANSLDAQGGDSSSKYREAANNATENSQFANKDSQTANSQEIGNQMDTSGAHFTALLSHADAAESHAAAAELGNASYHESLARDHANSAQDHFDEMMTVNAGKEEATTRDAESELDAQDALNRANAAAERAGQVSQKQMLGKGGPGSGPRKGGGKSSSLSEAHAHLDKAREHIDKENYSEADKHIRAAMDKIKSTPGSEGSGTPKGNALDRYSRVAAEATQGKFLD